MLHQSFFDCLTLTTAKVIVGSSNNILFAPEPASHDGSIFYCRRKQTLALLGALGAEDNQL